MNKMMKVGAYGLMTGFVAMITGCALEPIQVDYTMPANKVSDVSKIDFLALNVTANVRGNLAGDNARNAALVRQMLTERLYHSGYFRVTDDIWMGENGADNIKQLLKNGEEGGHLYDSYTSDGSVLVVCPACNHSERKGAAKAKARLDVAVDLELNSETKTADETITLATTPYVPVKVKEGMPPTSAPNVAAAQKRTETHPVTKFVTTAKGQVTVKLSGLDGDKAPVAYENTFKIGSDKPVSEDAQPTQMKAFASTVAPAVAGILADLAPHKVPQALQPVEGGDERVLTLVYATAFGEATDFVKELGRSGLATEADFVNQGIAFEALGKFKEAKSAYKKALALNKEKPNADATAGIARVDKALAGAAKVAKAGKGNVDTKFTK